MSASEATLVRRRAIRMITNYLRSDLYEPSRNYDDQKGSKSFTCEVGEVAVDHEREVLWGSPLGWRVLIHVDLETENVRLTIYDRKGEVYKESPLFTTEQLDDEDAFYWINDNLL